MAVGDVRCEPSDCVIVDQSKGKQLIMVIMMYFVAGACHG